MLPTAATAPAVHNILQNKDKAIVDNVLYPSVQTVIGTRSVVVQNLGGVDVYVNQNF